MMARSSYGLVSSSTRPRRETRFDRTAGRWNRSVERSQGTQPAALARTVTRVQLVEFELESVRATRLDSNRTPA